MFFYRLDLKADLIKSTWYNIVYMYLLLFIRIIHYAIIVALAISPFVTWPAYRNAAGVFLIYLLLQYLTGYKKCGLTILEYLILGKDYESGFIYRTIMPLITIPENYFDNALIIVHVLYIYLLRRDLGLGLGLGFYKPI